MLPPPTLVMFAVTDEVTTATREEEAAGVGKVEQCSRTPIRPTSSSSMHLDKEEIENMTVCTVRFTFDHREVLQAAQKQWHMWRSDKAPSGPKLPWKWNTSFKRKEINRRWESLTPMYIGQGGT